MPTFTEKISREEMRKLAAAIYGCHFIECAGGCNKIIPAGQEYGLCSECLQELLDQPLSYETSTEKTTWL